MKAPTVLLGIGIYITASTSSLDAHEPTPASQGGLPRYRLEVGQELSYEGSSHFAYDKGALDTTDRSTYWVTRANPDRTWHIVAHNENTFAQTFGKDPGQSIPGRKQELFDQFDVSANGQVQRPPRNLESGRLLSVFLPLPGSMTGAEAGWQTEDTDGTKSLYRLAPQNDAPSGQWVFEKTEKGLINEIYLMSSKSFIHFDAHRGLVTKIKSENTQGYGFNGKGTGVLELKSVKKRDEKWIARLAEQADTFLQAKDALREAQESDQKGVNPKEAMAKAEKMLREGRDKVTLPVVEAQFDAQLKQLPELSNDLTEDEKEGAKLLNKPAAEWETTDLDGHRHALADYRGKVVVMDFWYRGCGWCIRAMPQIKEVAEDFRGKAVAVLGMNTDGQEKDARFVAEKLKLNYPTLKALGLPEKYGVRGFPTLIIIDQKGFVRARHVGYSANLREILTKTINGLLASDR